MNVPSPSPKALAAKHIPCQAACAAQGPRCSIKKRLLRLVKKYPGLTACGYTKLLKHPSVYGSASVLKQLHREANAGVLIRVKEPGLRKTVQAWHFSYK